MEVSCTFRLQPPFLRGNDRPYAVDRGLDTAVALPGIEPLVVQFAASSELGQTVSSYPGDQEFESPPETRGSDEVLL